MTEFSIVPDSCLLCIAKTAANHMEPDETRELVRELIKRLELYVLMDKLQVELYKKRSGVVEYLKATRLQKDEE